MGFDERRADICAMRKARPHPKPTRQPTYIRAWRDFRGLTQEQFVDRLETETNLPLSTGQLSRIETGKQEYRQDQLEAFATVLRCQPADLLTRDPTDADAIWSIYEQLKPARKREAAAILEAILNTDRTGTDG